jgi:hypothetical protein
MVQFNEQFGNDKKWQLTADDMKEQYKEIPFATDLMNGVNPYSPTVATTCFLRTEDLPDGRPRRNSDGLEIFNFAADLTADMFTGSDMYVCDVLSRTDKLTDGNLYNYTVLAKISDDVSLQLVVCTVGSLARQHIAQMQFFWMLAILRFRLQYRFCLQQDIVQVENVPHAAVTFVDQPYKSDQNNPGVFRHYIAIRDNDFPQAWRDRRA